MSRAETRVCCCLGCIEDAVAKIDHPKHGQRTVCESDINGHDVVEWLVGPEHDARRDQEVSIDA
ncbi:hypothetical protein [Halobellus rufus]|uniref:hypothetical protein n=1 Tax=Halobellus rufus TaxID=1448860 RepID=UPI000678E5FD|nr:hypothetical protein [Halobellus rufus]